MSKIQFSIYLIPIIAALSIVQATFYTLQSAQANSATATIQALLRQETSISNTFLISRTLSDLRDSKMVKCVRLTEVSNQMIHLDMRFKDSCNQSFFSLTGKEVITILQGLNGELWKIEFQSVNDKFFFASLWLARILITIIFVFATWFYLKKAEKLKKENKKKEKLKNLAEQAAHDVASPLTLMNALIASNHMSKDAKEHLEQAKNSIYSIIGSLREQSHVIENETIIRLENVNLSAVVKTIVKEKKVTFPNISYDLPDLLIVKANATELERVVSNILNNAIEASDSKGNINISFVDGTAKTLKISDRGIGIPHYIIEKLGDKGATFGKKSGTGRGLFHAKQCMESWGGSLNIESLVQQGTNVFLNFKTN